ncbi:MAG TPA: PEP-CTERM sorting domain-containing protein [Pirellulales bacterium]|jgi:hypothetical protein|nr:PEP-CTERM sorting domain-containing protein [Pirellulales bacterium]
MATYAFSATRAVGIRFLSFSLVVICGLALATIARATPLPVGTSIPSSFFPGLAGNGTLLADTGALPFSTATYTGTLRSEVFTNDAANPFGQGNLTFTYLITDDTGPDSIDRFTIDGYGAGGISTDASYQAPTTGVIPATFDRSASGDVLGASFSLPALGFGVVAPGTASALVVIHTNSQVFTANSAFVIDSNTAQVATLAPVAVPEPASLVLLAIGSLLALFWARR